jgi:hypothetical protein
LFLIFFSVFLLFFFIFSFVGFLQARNKQDGTIVAVKIIALEEGSATHLHPFVSIFFSLSFLRL